MNLWESDDSDGNPIWDFDNRYVYLEYTEGMPWGRVIPSRGNWGYSPCQRHLFSGSFPFFHYTNHVAGWQLDDILQPFLSVLYNRTKDMSYMARFLYWLSLLATREHRSVHHCSTGAMLTIRRRGNTLGKLCASCASELIVHNRGYVLRQHWCASDVTTGVSLCKHTMVDSTNLAKAYSPATVVY